MKRILLIALGLTVGLLGGCRTGVEVVSPDPASIPELESKEAAAEQPASQPVAAPEPAPAAEPEVHENKIKWTTASEVDNFGYDVYRSESEDGPFEVLNGEVIEGAGTVDEPTAYQFVDDTIDPHKAYHYYVESISMSGVRERFTPIIRASPKVPSTEQVPAAEQVPTAEPEVDEAVDEDGE